MLPHLVCAVRSVERVLQSAAATGGWLDEEFWIQQMHQLCLVMENWPWKPCCGQFWACALHLTSSVTLALFGVGGW